MSRTAHWNVELYEINGQSPVKEFIENQSSRNQAKIYAEFDDLVEFGLMPRGEKLKHLEGKLWELRFSGESTQFRFIYFSYNGKRIVILHGFHKKSRKTPKRELDIARSRRQEFLD